MIGVGVFVAAVAALAGMLWANRFQHVEPDGIEAADEIQHDWQALKASYGKLPTASQAFAPIFVPILLICFGSIAKFPSLPLGEGFVFDVLTFLGQPLTALVIGLFLSVRLLKSDNKIEEFGERISKVLRLLRLFF